MKIIAKKGLDIPLAGKPTGSIQALPCPQQISLNLRGFEGQRLQVLAKVGDSIQIGQPLLENRRIPGQMFVSPAGGTITEIRRGHKRQLLDVVIRIEASETFYEQKSPTLENGSRKDLINWLMRCGLFPHIRLRPFNLLPPPELVPRDIFISAFETRPFEPPMELQVSGCENFFQAGLDVLSKLTTGKVHLVYGAHTQLPIFLNAERVERHTIWGPHPAGSSSFQIHKIAPIRRPDDYVWSLSALDVVIIGRMLIEGRYHTDRILSIAGNGIREEKRGYFKGRTGFPIRELGIDRVENHFLCFISGNPLTGEKVEWEDFLGFNHTCFSAIPENTVREAFHFLKPGLHKFSATRAYLSGHVEPPQKGYAFTTNQHGEERAFIDPTIYDKVMPMRIPTAFLIKAILAEDFDLAEKLGLLEVIPEDFALQTFIDPSKINMVEIVKSALHQYSQEFFGFS